MLFSISRGNTFTKPNPDFLWAKPAKYNNLTSILLEVHYSAIESCFTGQSVSF